MPIFRQQQHDLQLPQLDFNYGVGPRIQLTLEVPYVFSTVPGEARSSGWSNAFPGVKWRFLDDYHGWNVSIFPQVETAGLSGSVRKGIADSGSRFLMPVEIQKSVGPMELDFEAGYYFPFHGHENALSDFRRPSIHEKVQDRWRVYNDYAMGLFRTTRRVGSRWSVRIHKGLIFLSWRPQFQPCLERPADVSRLLRRSHPAGAQRPGATCRQINSAHRGFMARVIRACATRALSVRSRQNPRGARLRR